MKRLAVLTTGLMLAGCTGMEPMRSGNLWKSVSSSASRNARMIELPYFGQNLMVEDPSNSDYVGQTCKTPKMPLKPTGQGKLTGTVFVLDPGHGGKDTGAYWVETLTDGRKVAFWESAYSYAMTDKLSDMLRKEGAIVYLTAFSEVASNSIPGSIEEPLPVPRDATSLWTNKSVVPKKPGWWERIHMGNDVYQRLKKDYKVVYLALHVDAMETRGWKGSHVLVKDMHHPPKIAKALAKRIQDEGIARTQFGLPKPLIDRTRDLFLFRKTQNPNTILWEMALPQDAEDSFRMRDEKSREETARIALNAAIDFAQDAL
ncbi:MAG TPA: N-acetylmuramoyl-L-alanine amidase [Fimbriimonas sp.]|nr:N-acetylmuramoyl-L-alanine amidase [Fimbriimonas sp.]